MNPNIEIRENIRDLLADVAASLDEEEFDQFLEKCSDEFTYRVVANSPELGIDMVWLDHDKGGLENMFKMLPQHVRMAGRIVRHLSGVTFRPVADSCFEATSQLLLIHTNIEGLSRIMAAGASVDTVRSTETGDMKLIKREIRLDTRDWSPGLHVIV